MEKGDEILAQAMVQTPGLLRIRDAMVSLGERPYTYGEVVAMLSEAIKADGDWDRPAANITEDVLDYLAVVGVPLASSLYFISRLSVPIEDCHDLGARIIALDKLSQKMHAGYKKQKI